MSRNAVNIAVTVQDRAGRYVTDLTPGDFSVFENGAKVEVAVPFTNDRTPFFEALAGAEAYGQTALNDAIAVSPEFADKGRNNKRALLLLTDGIENDSLVSADRALEIARRVEILVYE